MLVKYEDVALQLSIFFVTNIPKLLEAKAILLSAADVDNKQAGIFAKIDNFDLEIPYASRIKVINKLTYQAHFFTSLEEAIAYCNFSSKLLAQRDTQCTALPY